MLAPAWLSTLVLCVSVVAILAVPGTLLTRLRQRTAAVSAERAQLSALKAQQAALLGSVLTIQERIASAGAALTALEAAASTLAGPESGDAEEERAKQRQAAFAAFRARVEVEIATMEADARKEFDGLRDTVVSLRDRFLVKWHGDDGVKTSRHLASEQEATAEFERVGDFAKKLLMFDGARWVVLQSYGAERWLKHIRNDGTLQDGDGKPTKAPKKPKAQESDAAGGGGGGGGDETPPADD